MKKENTMKSKILAGVTVLALVIPGLCSCDNVEHANKYYEDTGAIHTSSETTIGEARIWTSPDGVEYWVIGVGYYQMMAPRYDKDGNIVIHKGE